MARGVWHPPVGRRRLGSVIVWRCPSCGLLHLHRAVSVQSADGAFRVGSCGAEYQLDVRPALIGGAA